MTDLETLKSMLRRVGIPFTEAKISDMLILNVNKTILGHVCFYFDTLGSLINLHGEDDKCS